MEYHREVIPLKMGRDFYKKAQIQIANLRERKPEMREVLDFCETLFKEQEKTNSSFSFNSNGLDINSYKDRNARGVPLLTAEDININWILFDTLIQRIGELVTRRVKNSFPQSVSFITQNEEELHKSLVQGVMKEEPNLERLASQYEMDYNLFVFLIHQAFTPFMEKYAEKLGEYNERNLWLKGYCPICGREPLMAKFEKETGKRLLQCCLCRTEWVFRRIECPFCSNREQNYLRFFFVEDDELHRVDVCDKCKKYIKTVNLRDREEDSVLFIEYVTTIHLDRLAQKEGFLETEIGLLGV